MKAAIEALREEITNRDNTHESLKTIDDMLHVLIEMTKPKHTIDEDCGCPKETLKTFEA